MSLNAPGVYQAVAQLKRHDMEGLDTLVTLYQAKAVRAAFLITSDVAQAEDIAQTAFVQVVAKIYQYDEQRPFEPWFMRIVVNFALQAVRRSQRDVAWDMAIMPGNPAKLIELISDEKLLVDDQVERNEMRHIILSALDDLPPVQRAAIVMRYYLDMSEQEMVEALNLPKGTIKWRLHAARQQLRSLLSRFYTSYSVSSAKEVIHE